MNPTWTLIHPRATLEMLGFLPVFLSTSDPRPAKEQLHSAYAHGGGWNPFPGFTFHHESPIEQWRLSYPGDPPTPAIAYTRLRDEMVILFAHSWVAVVGPDGTYEIARMD